MRLTTVGWLTSMLRVRPVTADQNRPNNAGPELRESSDESDQTQQECSEEQPGNQGKHDGGCRSAGFGWIGHAVRLPSAQTYVGADVLICPAERSSAIFRNGVARREIKDGRAALDWTDEDICPYVSSTAAEDAHCNEMVAFLYRTKVRCT